MQITFSHLLFSPQTHKAFTFNLISVCGNEIIHLQFVLFPVDDDGADLLIHEYEDGDQESGNKASQINPPRVLPKRHDDPAAVWTCGLRDRKQQRDLTEIEFKVRMKRKWKSKCSRSLVKNLNKM